MLLSEVDLDKSLYENTDSRSGRSIKKIFGKLNEMFLSPIAVYAIFLMNKNKLKNP